MARKATNGTANLLKEASLFNLLRFTYAFLLIRNSTAFFTLEITGFARSLRFSF